MFLRLLTLTLAFVALASSYVFVRYFYTHETTIEITGKYRQHIVNHRGSSDLAFITTEQGVFRLPVNAELGDYQSRKALWQALKPGCIVKVSIAPFAPEFSKKGAERLDAMHGDIHCKTAPREAIARASDPRKITQNVTFTRNDAR